MFASYVGLQVPRLTEGSEAIFAFVKPLSSVDALVSLEVLSKREGLLTHDAAEALYFGVD
jgi:hypothetical protein